MGLRLYRAFCTCLGRLRVIFDAMALQERLLYRVRYRPIAYAMLPTSGTDRVSSSTAEYAIWAEATFARYSRRRLAGCDARLDALERVVVVGACRLPFPMRMTVLDQIPA